MRSSRGRARRVLLDRNGREDRSRSSDGYGHVNGQHKPRCLLGPRRAVMEAFVPASRTRSSSRFSSIFALIRRCLRRRSLTLAFTFPRNHTRRNQDPKTAGKKLISNGQLPITNFLASLTAKIARDNLISFEHTAAFCRCILSDNRVSKRYVFAGLCRVDPAFSGRHDIHTHCVDPIDDLGFKPHVLPADQPCNRIA